MNEHGIEELIGILYEMVQDAKNVPFSGDKCSIEREKALDLLDEISNQLPGELKQAKTIVESRSELITNAKRERSIWKQRTRQTRWFVQRRRRSRNSRESLTTMLMMHFAPPKRQLLRHCLRFVTLVQSSVRLSIRRQRQIPQLSRMYN